MFFLYGLVSLFLLKKACCNTLCDVGILQGILGSDKILTVIRIVYG